MSFRSRSQRSGVVAVESTVVLLAFFILLLAIIVGGISIFRYQQVTCLSHEATRWAAARSSSWSTNTGNSLMTKNEIFNNAVAPLAVGLTQNQLNMQVWWINGATGAAVDWDSAPRTSTTLDTNNNTISNRVRVTLTYSMTPGVLIVGPLSLQSTSELPMF